MTAAAIDLGNPVYVGVPKPRLSLARIVQMNIGFFGLQFSFGLQQANMGPIYSFLGADEATMPLLWLAGPMTGLLVQPFIGALSDRTVTRWGRRTPYFLIGAVLCSLCLLAMPYSPALWVAASLLWILDAANNVTMEPYRAYVGDRLDASQRPIGFMTQSAFTGLAQTLSYLSPSILVWWGMDLNAVDPNGIPHVTRIAFLIGAVLSLGSILWSVIRVPELPLTPAEVAEMQSRRLSFGAALADIRDAVVEMPPAMRKLAVAMLFQWYAMFAYWQYISHALSRSLFGTADAGSEGFRQAVLATGQLGGLYNFVAFVAAFALIPLTRAVGPRRVHAVCVACSGCAMLAIPHMTTQAALVLPMIGIGLGWASLMGCPYIMLANSIPPARTGIYMGIFNMFIVLPMLVETLTMPLIYGPLLGGDARNVLMLGGVFMLIAGGATLLVGRTRTSQDS
ncbi:MFS transporter [Sphingomonas donggukensis]|uniref:MFS transporter n=1 Tax=Sphingomonas donggukensis TaxID=2949093 RepID=A0ABY4TUY9_9SPHN|nr:MFS transporter [Sphingomonas donggukensis]URW76196.1 MFS transporter [Sphingomonas donggukensis]